MTLPSEESIVTVSIRREGDRLIATVADEEPPMTNEHQAVSDEDTRWIEEGLVWDIGGVREPQPHVQIRVFERPLDGTRPLTPQPWFDLLFREHPDTARNLAEQLYQAADDAEES